MRNNNIRRIGTDHWYRTESKKNREQTLTERRVSDRTPKRTKRRVSERVPAFTEQFVFLSFDSRNSNLYKETERHHAFEKLILVTLV